MRSSPLLCAAARLQPRAKRGCRALIVLLVALLVASASAASADTPSPEQIRRQRAEAARLDAVAAAQAGRTARAESRLGELAADANAAFEEYVTARAAAAAAEALAVKARGAAEIARGRQLAAEADLARVTAIVDQSRTDLGHYAAAAYRSGGGLGSLANASALLDSGDVTDFSRRVAILQWVGVQEGRALDRVEAAQALQASATRRATDAADAARATALRASAAERRARSASAVAGAARHQADLLVAAQRQVVGALAQATARTKSAARVAHDKAAQMERARRIAEQRRIAEERRRAREIAQGHAVTPDLQISVSDCSGNAVGTYANGRIPISALCPLWGAPGQVLRADAAAAFSAMSQAYAERWGSPICVTDSYRSYGMQVDLKRRKPVLAAVPGTSNHGWGQAVDLCDGINSFGTATHNWMRVNAPRFGWYHPSWAEPGGSKPEPWHWEFAG